jgi:hypothetical protein
LSGGLAVFAGVVSPVRLSLHAMRAPSPPAHRQDTRLQALRQFFRENQCPAAPYAADFLETADGNELDWRLLPSISFVESAGGKAAPHNNLFGWASGRAHFSSPKAAIQTVGYQLGHGEAYKHKSLRRLLTTYNPVGNYAKVVESVMRRIAPAQ